MPANSARADETQKGDPGIGHERLGELVGLGKENLTPAGRQPGLMQQAYQIQAGERRGVRRLDDHRAAGGDGRHDLMDDQIQRVIEGRDGGDDADRLEDREGPPICARRRQPHRDFPPGHDAQLVGGVAHAVDGAVGFDQRVGQRLAPLARDLTSEMLALAFHQFCELAEDLDPLMRLQPCAPVREEPSGGSRSSGRAPLRRRCQAWRSAPGRKPEPPRS